jgi:hypothetical protein
MKQAYEKEAIMFQAAQSKIIQRLNYEFEKSEQDKDQELIKFLYEKKRALDAEIRRKKAQNGMVRGIISTGAFAAATFFSGGNVAVGAVAAKAADTAVESQQE